MDDFELIVKHIIAQAANGWAHRQRRDWQDSIPLSYHFWKSALFASGREAHPLWVDTASNQ